MARLTVVAIVSSNFPCVQVLVTPHSGLLCTHCFQVRGELFHCGSFFHSACIIIVFSPVSALLSTLSISLLLSLGYCHLIHP